MDSSQSKLMSKGKPRYKNSEPFSSSSNLTPPVRGSFLHQSSSNISESCNLSKSSIYRSPSFKQLENKTLNIVQVNHQNIMKKKERENNNKHKSILKYVKKMKY